MSQLLTKRQTLFIFICCFTSGFYILSLFAERWLRHVDRLPVDLRPRETIFGMSSSPPGPGDLASHC